MQKPMTWWIFQDSFSGANNWQVCTQLWEVSKGWHHKGPISSKRVQAKEWKEIFFLNWASSLAGCRRIIIAVVECILHNMEPWSHVTRRGIHSKTQLLMTQSRTLNGSQSESSAHRQTLFKVRLTIDARRCTSPRPTLGRKHFCVVLHRGAINASLLCR